MPRDRFVVAGLSRTPNFKAQGQITTYYVLDSLCGDREIPIPKNNGSNGTFYWSHEVYQRWTYHLDTAQAWVDELHERYGRIEDFHGYEAYAEIEDVAT